ncbi:ABC transporter substrate-binding protein [Nocardia sp. NBC_00565]|uniref:ABC transporter substrate-binding protein n=1 Tax=Nocardia sp. NBC_00565 TaxID=2975993 RepID=UPI002E806FF6|nr:ABC transporter substrate-binding protein [Nocardia sp. NBC_00565]WUC05759.1 ABC transporter substrate-binding protein [Nocardia sp. NBC_00565]
MSSTSESTLGTPNKATGAPIDIGFISEGKAAAIDNTDEIKAAKAAAAYANDYLGGLGGRPIKIKVCETLAQPATAKDCANQMVAANVAAVFEGVSGEVDQTIEVLAPAKIPIIMHTASTQAALATPGVFMMFNGLSYFGAPAAAAKTDGATKTAMVVIGVPAAEGPARQIGALLYGNAGVALNVVAVPPGTADPTPQITAADAAGRYHVLGNDTFCTSALKAIKTIDPNAKITIIDRCISPGTGKAIPGGYKGLSVVATTDLATDTADGKLFAAVLDKYGDGAKFGATAAFGYAPMLGAINALNTAKPAELTPAAIQTALQSAAPTQYPLSGGIMFQCNGKQIGLSPNICSADGIMATAATDGALTDYRRIPADANLYSMPGR